MSILTKKITSIPSIFLKLLLLKNVVTWMPESLSFRKPFGGQRDKRSQKLLKPTRQQFCPNFLLILNKLSCASCLLAASEILRPFFNTLTTSHMYSCHNWQKFQEQVQTQRSSKLKLFLESVIEFFKSASNSEHSEKKITFKASIFPELLIAKNVLTWMPESSCFRTFFGS